MKNGVAISLYRIDGSKFFIKISDESTNFLNTQINNIIWGLSAIKVAIIKFLILRLKNTPEKFLIINGTPGINLNIIYKKNGFFLIIIFLNDLLNDFLKCFANK